MAGILSKQRGSSILNRTLVGTQINTQKSNLKTSAGLYDLAVRSGLQKDADRILETQKGEETKKIFSGGFISDIFDVLNTLQYGVVGVLKGKGFVEGVRTRQSFSDKDALGDNGIPGLIAGIALDIAVDPLTYIAPLTILKKVPGLSKFGKAIKGLAFGKKVEKTIETAEGLKKFMDIEGGTQLGKWLSQKFVWMSGADPIFKETYERSIKNIAQGTTNVADMAKGVAQLSPEVSKKILSKKFFPELKGERFIRTPLKELQKILKPKEFENVSRFYNKLDDLGRQAADLGLIPKGKFEENIGEYIKNAYLEYEQKVGRKGLFGRIKTGIKGVKGRKVLTPDKMAELGQIDNPAFLLFKSTFDLIKDVENAKLFNAVNKSFASDVMQAGFKQMPKTQRAGSLAGKWIPENMFDYIQEITEPINYNLGKKLVADFKFFKVVMNPATHARNIMSNQILNYWKLGMNPLNPKTIEANVTALGEITKKGGKFMGEAKTAGYGLDTFASNEIFHLLDSPEALGFSKKLGGKWGNFKQKMGNIYQGEENWAKLSAFIFQRNKGIGIEEAWKAAESATFNYAQVTPFIRKLRTSLFGFPFITFTTKATPLAVETALKAPQRISAFGKIKQAIESQSDIETTDRERASEAPWIKDGFYIKLPMKDKHGRSAYFDLTYIIPFGDLVAGDFFERKIVKETGLPETLPTALASKSPFFNFVKEISRNQDFYGNSIWRESDDSYKQTQDLFRHFNKTYLPPLVADQIPGGYNKKGERQFTGFVGATMKPGDEQNQRKTLMQEILRQVGAKVQPIDADIQEMYQEWNSKKALENLLRERGVISQFDINYIPK